MKFYSSGVLILSILFFSCGEKGPIYKSDTLIVNQLGDHTYQHISYLTIGEYTNVQCNGMLIIDEGEAIIFDTPSEEPVAREMIDWLKDEMNVTIKLVVPTHYHIDCLGGLDVFHSHNVGSLAHQETIDSAYATEVSIPQRAFENRIVEKVGSQEVEISFFGEGHTPDNVVAYLPTDQTLFGGCLIKSLGAGKGNLADANVQEWSSTVTKIKKSYPNVRIVIPGHGNPGSQDLLDYTIEMFSEN